MHAWATRKGKDSKRDTESRSFLHDLVNDALAVRGQYVFKLMEEPDRVLRSFFAQKKGADTSMPVRMGFVY